jgi:hypothetical protein
MKTLLAALAFVALASGATPALADSSGGCGNCAVQQPDPPALPQTPEEGCGGANWATPAPARQRANAEPVIVVGDANCSGC